MTSPATKQIPLSDLPRSNGELVFEQPWESRAFGLAASLEDDGHFTWQDFQRALITEVAAHQSDPGEYHYDERWLATLEALLAERGLVDPAEVDDRADVLCRRPAGNDHRHDDHDHGDHVH